MRVRAPFCAPFVRGIHFAKRVGADVDTVVESGGNPIVTESLVALAEEVSEVGLQCTAAEAPGNAAGRGKVQRKYGVNGLIVSRAFD